MTGVQTCALPISDINDGAGGPFGGSEWHKQLFRESDFLLENIESFQTCARSELEQRFFDLALAARSRLHDRLET